MKIAATIAKVLTALATVAGIVYIVATYGDKIVAWAKSLLSKFSCCECDGCECNENGECTCECECDDCDCECEEEVEEPAAEEVAEEPAAEEADFEG